MQKQRQAELLISALFTSTIIKTPADEGTKLINLSRAAAFATAAVAPRAVLLC
jgi:hypothetical protein